MLSQKQLAHAIALSDCGNFHRAAESQNISQPAFSRSIRALEEALGVTLFDRTSGDVKPTLYGEALLRRAQTIIGETAELEREIQLLTGSDAGVFSVAMGPYPLDFSGRRAIGQLISQHPHLACHIRQSDWREVAEQVVNKEVDIGFAEVSAAQTDEMLETEIVGEHGLVLYCRGGHSLGDRTQVKKSDLDGYPIATIRVPIRMAEVLPGRGNYDKESGHFVPAIEVADLTTARTVVMGSEAFGIASPLQIEPWLKTGELKVLPFSAPWMNLHYGFIYRRDRMQSPAARTFMELVRTIERDAAPRNQELMARYVTT